MRQAMFSEDMAAEPGLLQRIEPRVKLLTLLGLLVAAAPRPPHPGAARRCTRAPSCSRPRSGLSLSFFIKRVWLFIPIFTGIVVLPATFSFITHGRHRRAVRHVVRPPGRA